jgi:sec-independent protein translocase protein TatA/sec-independent protein translocase protein TatB
MFGLGMSEIVLILVIALLVIGPKKLPDVAKALGKGYGEFKRAMSDFKEAVNIDLEEDNRKKKTDVKDDLNDIYENKWKEDMEKSDVEVIEEMKSPSDNTAIVENKEQEKEKDKSMDKSDKGV